MVLLHVSSNELSTNLGLLETYLKLSAYVTAAAFFLWKACTGWLIINLSVSITTQRQYFTAGQDWLVVMIGLDKGSTDAL